MNSPHRSLPTRRAFLHHTALAAAAAFTLPRAAFSASRGAGSSFAIGCLSRPWAKWSFDEMLDGVKGAGYTNVGLLTPTAGDLFIAAGATPEYLATLKRKIAARGLAVNSGRLRTKDTAPLAEANADIRQQLDNAHALGLRHVIHTGTSRAEHYAQHYRMMAYAAAYGQERGIQLAMKPHGGVNAAAAEMLQCLKEVNHPNFKIWYDAGNIIHYTGKDPLKEMEPLLPHVTAFVAKDCAALKGEVMIQLGTGRVDFAGLFGRLHRAGFRGLVMLESCAVGGTPAETTANAKACRQFLETHVARATG